MKLAKFKIFTLIVFVALIGVESVAIEMDSECKKTCEVEKRACRRDADAKVDNAENPMISEVKPASKQSDWPAERREELNKRDNFKNQKAVMRAACYAQFKQCEKKCVPQSVVK